MGSVHEAPRLERQSSCAVVQVHTEAAAGREHIPL